MKTILCAVAALLLCSCATSPETGSLSYRTSPETGGFSYNANGQDVNGQAFTGMDINSPRFYMNDDQQDQMINRIYPK